MGVSFAYGEIIWPEDGREANILLRDFMLKALRAIGYEFPGVLPNPMDLADGYVLCKTGQLECKELAEKWRGQISDARDLYSKNALSARLAMLLLSIDESDDQEMMSEKLSWFMEFLECGGENYRLVDEILVEYFIGYVGS